MFFLLRGCLSHFFVLSLTFICLSTTKTQASDEKPENQEGHDMGEYVFEHTRKLLLSGVNAFDLLDRINQNPNSPTDLIQLDAYNSQSKFLFRIGQQAAKEIGKIGRPLGETHLCTDHKLADYQNILIIRESSANQIYRASICYTYLLAESLEDSDAKDNARYIISQAQFLWMKQYGPQFLQIYSQRPANAWMNVGFLGALLGVNALDLFENTRMGRFIFGRFYYLTSLSLPFVGTYWGHSVDQEGVSLPQQILLRLPQAPLELVAVQDNLYSTEFVRSTQERCSDFDALFLAASGGSQIITSRLISQGLPRVGLLSGGLSQMAGTFLKSTCFGAVIGGLAFITYSGVRHENQRNELADQVRFSLNDFLDEMRGTDKESALINSKKALSFYGKLNKMIQFHSQPVYVLTQIMLENWRSTRYEMAQELCEVDIADTEQISQLTEDHKKQLQDTRDRFEKLALSSLESKVADFGRCEGQLTHYRLIEKLLHLPRDQWRPLLQSPHLSNIEKQYLRNYLMAKANPAQLLKTRANAQAKLAQSFADGYYCRAGRALAYQAYFFLSRKRHPSTTLLENELIFQLLNFENLVEIYKPLFTLEGMAQIPCEEQ